MMGLMSSGAIDLILLGLLAHDPVSENAIAKEIKTAIDKYAAGDAPAIGGFLYAVFSNNLATAAQRGDPYNKVTLAAIAFYAARVCPPASFGTEKKVDAWLEAAKKKKNASIAETFRRRELKGSDSLSDARD